MSTVPTTTQLVPLPAPVVAAAPTAPTYTAADVIAEVIARGRSDRTRRAYRADLADFLVWLGCAVTLPHDPAELLDHEAAARAAANTVLTQLVGVREVDIQRYLQHLTGTTSDPGLQPTTRNRRLTPLRLLFARLHRYHLIASNPLDDIKSARVGTISETVYLDDDAVATLVTSLDGTTIAELRDRALILFLLYTGVRSSEALGVDVADLRTVGRHRVAWVTGKGGARQRVKVSPLAWAALAPYLDAGKVTEGAVFRRLRHVGSTLPDAAVGRTHRLDGRLSYSGLYCVLRARFQAAGLEDRLTPHSTRHSFITLAIRHGASIAQAQAAARHADPRTTMRYAHDMDTLEDHAADYVGRR